MRVSVLLLAFTVSSLNILLNFLASRASIGSENWASAIASKKFALAFLVGTASLLGLVTLYYVGRVDRLGLANAMILMGATSISIGVLVGKVLNGDRVSLVDWILFFLIVAVLIFKFISPSSNEQ